MPKRRTSVMQQRLGLRGWHGSKPFDQWSKTLVTRTLGQGHNPGTTTGAAFELPVNNWNDPIGALGTLVAGNGSLAQQRHPMDHDNALSAGYRRVQVLSWKAEIDVNWILAADPPQDFSVAYAFGSDSSTEVALGSGGAARTELMEFQTNPRWTVKRFNATPGVNEHPRGRKIVISVPNVFAYCKVVGPAQTTLEPSNQSVSHSIADTSFTSNFPSIQLWCYIAIYTETGLAMAIDSVQVLVAITQKVKIMRQHVGAENMDEGEPDNHA